jgi:hypothetical protein
MTTVRLAVVSSNERSERALMTDVRLAVAGPEIAISKALSPVVRLAHAHQCQGTGTLTNPDRIQEARPALLVSYVYAAAFIKNQSRYFYRDWMMDSGAYSAYNSGKTINIDHYVAYCHERLAADKTLTEIIALDVIGSGEGSLKNALYMKSKGLEVIPVFHYGEDLGILREYNATFKKVGLSCRFGEPEKASYRFYDRCFATGWPKKYHSFGWTAEPMLMRYPFHSCDSSSWEQSPCAFGSWKAFGKMSIRGGSQNLRAEVEWYLKLERQLQNFWAKEMAILEGGKQA